MFEEAMFIAVNLESGAPLLNWVRIIARKQRNMIVESMVDYHNEKSNPGSSATTLLKSMT